MKKILVCILLVIILLFETTSIEIKDVRAAKLEGEKNVLIKNGISAEDIISTEVSDNISYFVKMDKSIEKLTFVEERGDYYKVIVTDGKISNTVIFDGSDLYVDGNKITSVDSSGNVSKNAVIYKSVYKGTKPYGKLKDTSYTTYVSSGKQNISLGKSIDSLAASTLAIILGHCGWFSNLGAEATSLAKAIKDALQNISPKTQYLGSTYKTYRHGELDYKYDVKLYTNTKCTGSYDREKTYEHFQIR